MKQQSGFTIIELIVVIAILGILASAALPRFVNVVGDAHDSAVDGVLGGFATGVALARAQYIANGLVGAQLDVAGFGNGDIDISAAGFPVSAGSNQATLTTAAHCTEVFEGVLQGGAPDLTSLTDIAATNLDDAIATGSEYGVLFDGDDNICLFYYLLDLPAVPAAGQALRAITYDPATGAIELDTTDTAT